MKNSGLATAFGMLAGVGLATCASAHDLDRSGAFDLPLHVEHVKLPASKDNPGQKPEVRCAYYQNFMVKEVDLGEEGDEEISILPSKAACRKENVSGEWTISDNSWSGYLKGVFGNYIFLDADDGWNGGLGFAVYTPDARKLYDDVALGEIRVTHADVPAPQHIPSGKGISLRYTRLHSARCALVGDTAQACWARFEQKTKLDATMPDCRAEYQKWEEALGQHRRRVPVNVLPVTPSVVQYDVETVIGPDKPHAKPVAGPRPTCRPEE